MMFIIIGPGDEQFCRRGHPGPVSGRTDSMKRTAIIGVDQVVDQPDVQPRVGIVLQERGTDPRRVVDAEEDGYRHPQLALRLLPAALDQGADAVGLGQDVHGVAVDLLAEVGDGELMGVLAQQLDAEVGFELRQLAADRRLGHAEQHGRLRQAAALDHLAEYQQGVEVERQVLFHQLFQICNRVLHSCICFRLFQQLLVVIGRGGGPHESRQPGDETRKRTLDRRLSRTRPRTRVTRRLRFARVLREGTRARLQEDLALRRAGGAGAEVRQLLHPRAEVPQHLDHHRPGQGRRDPRTCTTSARTAATRCCGRTTRSRRCQGRAPLLYCRFHGWRYKLDGSLHSATRKDLLLDFDADSCRVPAIQCEVWEGFIFINLNPHNTESVRSYLGELAHDIEGYPFEGPHQVYQFKAELQCNWKIFLDGFAESYHGPYLHASSFGALTAEARDAFDQPNPFTDALGYQLKGPHRMFSFSGEPSRKTPYSKPIECVMEASAAGPWNKRTDRGADAAGDQPDPVEKYGFDSYPVLPELHPDLRRVRFHGAHPLAHWSALAHLRNGGVLPAADHPQGAAGPGADDDVPQRHHPGGRQPVGRVAGDAEQRRADAFHHERRGDPAASPAQDGRRLCRGGGERGGADETTDASATGLFATRASGRRVGDRRRTRALREAGEQLDGRDQGVLRRGVPASPRKPSPTSTSSTTPNRCPTTSRTCATCSTR